MSSTRITYTSVNSESSKKCSKPVEIVDSWDSAIRKAKKKIGRLRQAIKTFEESKAKGECWPLDETAGTAVESAPAKGVNQS